MSSSSQDPTTGGTGKPVGAGKLVALFSSQSRLNQDTSSDKDQFSLTHQHVFGSNEPILRFSDPTNVAKSLLDGNRDHLLKRDLNL